MDAAPAIRTIIAGTFPPTEPVMEASCRPSHCSVFTASLISAEGRVARTSPTG